MTAVMMMSATWRRFDCCVIDMLGPFPLETVPSFLKVFGAPGREVGVDFQPWTQLPDDTAAESVAAAEATGSSSAFVIA